VNAGSGGGGGGGAWAGGGGGGGANDRAGGGGGGAAAYVGFGVTDIGVGSAVQDADGNGQVLMTEVRDGCPAPPDPPTSSPAAAVLTASPRFTG
jgi:hypothetical protein